MQEYVYVGGFYGASKEANIMEEIYERGPVAIAIEPQDDFMTFTKKHAFWMDFYQNTASTDSHSRRSLRSLLECSCFAFLVARYRSLLEMRIFG